MSQHQKLLNGRIPALSREVKNNCQSLFAAGKSTAEIAAETGVKQGTIRAWKARGRWGKADALAAQSDPLDVSDLDLAEKQERYTALMGDVALRVADHAARLDGEALVKSADKLLKADAVSRRALKLDSEKPFPVIQIAVLANSPGQIAGKRSERAALEAH